MRNGCISVNAAHAAGRRQGRHRPAKLWLASFRQAFADLQASLQASLQATNSRTCWGHDAAGWRVAR